MRTRHLLVAGLLINALALGGMVVLGLGVLGKALNGHPPQAGGIFRGLWVFFTLGTLLLAVDSPAGTRAAGAALCGLSIFASVLLFGDPNSTAIYGYLCCSFALLLHCAYQDHLSKALDNAQLKALIKRAYNRPLKLFFLGIACWIGAMFLPFAQILFVPISVVTFVGCPIWGFAYLGVVTVHLVRALKRREEEGEPVRAPAEF